jgi:hypothetical protein
MTWFAGAGQPTYGLAFNNSDIAALPNGNCVMSSISDITNNSFGDQYASISFTFVIPSTILVVGAAVAFYCYPLSDTGLTYGDGVVSPTSGRVALAPTLRAWGQDAPISGIATTSVVGVLERIILPATNFRFAMFSSLGVTITSGTIKYLTFN